MMDPFFWEPGLGGVLFLVTAFLKIGFWVIVVTLVVRLLRRDGHSPTERPSPALEVLEERFARGEISREEFAERRDVLRSRP
ncbi:MAG: SHOCT domain-containing protein [Actinomycetota bacterium]